MKLSILSFPTTYHIEFNFQTFEFKFWISWSNVNIRALSSYKMFTDLQGDLIFVNTATKSSNIVMVYNIGPTRYFIIPSNHTNL